MANVEYITGGLLDIDINKVKSTYNLYNKYSYSFIIHTETSEIPVEYVLSYENMRNYNTNVGDFIVLTFNMYLGTYAKKIYPNRDNMMCSVSKSYESNKLKSRTTEYKMVILNDDGAMESNSDFKKHTEGELNKRGLVKIEAQLYLLEVEGMKMLYCQGNYKKSTVKSVMGYLYAKWFPKITIGGSPLKATIDIYEPANDLSYDNIMIPTGTSLMDLASYLQNTNYGVYNGACGTYIQDYVGDLGLFIYPLYSVDRYNNTKDAFVLTVIRSNSPMTDVMENSWNVDGNNINIIAGSNTKVLDEGVSNMVNSGSAIINAPSENILNRNSEITDSNFTTTKDENLQGMSITERKDGISKARYVGHETNLYKVRSKLLAESMTTIQVPWHFSNQDLIYPGMPACYMFEDDEGIKKQYGTVQTLFTRYDGVKKTTSSLLVIKVGTSNIHKE